MKRDNRFRIGLVIVLIVASLFSLLPTFRMFMMDEEQRQRMKQEEPQAWKSLESKAIKLGLDLRGGMHLVMEIDLDAIPAEGRSDAQDRFLSIIRNRIDQYGVSEPVIQKQGNNRVVIQLAGIDNPEAARDLVGRTAVLTYNMLKSGDLVVDLVNRINRALYEGLVSGEIDRERIGLHVVQPETPDL
ncbi:MAG: hypothetical protein KAX13_05935, partial [Candidatus Krumholzibacteria bacterium]|nr:hypothetical protein [Candidatus Krumholzibacteria bacterium]